MRNKRSALSVIFMAALFIVTVNPAYAHFGAVIPSSDIVTRDDGGMLRLEIKFIHPMEGDYMEMARPREFKVMHGKNKTDLMPVLEKHRRGSAGHDAGLTFWKAVYQVRRPGDHTFYVTPEPYWEPAEDLFIVHYTKVCVNAFGLEQGWDDRLGLETEIVPFIRPYGLWTGNLFTGQVLLKGKPVPFAEVEVEYLNESPGNAHMVTSPSGPYVTQVVKADAGGMFSYAMPRAGWWGFAALNEADWTLAHDGQQKGVEIGAVYWVCTRDMK